MSELPDYESLKALLQQRLTAPRFYHSLCVMEEAVRLAHQLGADEEKARLAGLLHDVTKNTPNEEQLALLRENGVSLTPLEVSAPKLYHAMSGEVFLKEKLSITDSEVLSAVRYHTTARANMTLLEQVLYIADFVSVDRDYNGAEELRQTAHTDFCEAMKQALGYTVSELVERRAPIHPDTIAAWNEWVKKGEK